MFWAFLSVFGEKSFCVEKKDVSPLLNSQQTQFWAGMEHARIESPVFQRSANFQRSTFCFRFRFHFSFRFLREPRLFFFIAAVNAPFAL